MNSPLTIRNTYRKITKEENCKCGNPAFGFDCVCYFVKKNPGAKEFTCSMGCGIYTASRPRCSECEEVEEGD